jgi:hypothetical protein
MAVVDYVLSFFYHRSILQSFLGAKRPGREADHSTPSSAEVKNVWSCTFTHSPMCLHGMVLS